MSSKIYKYIMRITNKTPTHERNQYIDGLIKGRSINRISDYKSRKVKVYWHCSSCNHRWWSTPDTVVYQGSGCPVCWEKRKVKSLRKPSKQEALLMGKKTYFTGLPCKHGHISPRFVANRSCVECGSLHHKEWVKNNPDKQRILNERHKHLRRIQNILSREARKNAQPIWANQDIIQQIYADATTLTKNTNVQHHVHHIVPICENKLVCGLHCEDNLLIITEEEHKQLHSNKHNLQSLW